MTISNQNFLNVPYLGRVITDTHYDDPDRRGRHVAFLARAVSDYGIEYQGIACDEYTAVCIDESGIAKVYGAYPDYDDNAYFLTLNCIIPNNLPENCSPGNPLSWDQEGAAIRTYAVKGTPIGLYSFDVDTWEMGNGGNWENWSVLSGNFNAVEGSEIDCAPVATQSLVANAPTLNVYPNPTTRGDLTVESSSSLASDVSLFDSNGQLIKKWNNVQTSTDLAIDNLPAGVYMLEYLNVETRHVRRVLVR
jgi:hypothetical protein